VKFGSHLKVGIKAASGEDLAPAALLHQINAALKKIEAAALG